MVNASDRGPFITKTSKKPSPGQERGEIIWPPPMNWPLATTTFRTRSSRERRSPCRRTAACRHRASESQNPRKYRPRPRRFGNPSDRAATAPERGAESQAQVDALTDRLRRLRQPGERLQRALVQRRRLGVGAQARRAVARDARVARGGLPRFAQGGVVRERLRVLLDPGAGHAREGAGDRRVKGAALLAQEAAVGHVVGERVLEGVLDLGVEPRLVQQLGRLQPRKALAQGALLGARDGAQQWQRHLVADDGRGLQQSLVVGREAITACTLAGTSTVPSGRTSW